MSPALVHQPPRIVRWRGLLLCTQLTLLLPLGACAIPGIGDPHVSDVRGPSGETRGGEELAEAGIDAREGEDGDDDAYSATAGEEGVTISGHVAARVRSRWNDDVDDTDLYAVAGVDLSTGGEDPYDIHVLGRGAWDVDGDSGESTFFGLDDTYDSSLTGRLYEAHVDFPHPDEVELARLGRQNILETPTTAYFDGARLESSPWGVTDFSVGLYGGVPVHPYESSSSGDVVGGIYTTFRPWEDGRIRIDWMHLEDETRSYDRDNDLLAVGLRHHIGRNLRFEGNYSRLEDENRDAAIKGMWTLPEQRMTLRFSHYRLLEPQTDLVNELNPYFNTLATSQPYDQSQFQFSKGFTDQFELFGGFDVRRVDSESDIGKYNRDFDRYYLTAVLLETLPLGVVLSATGEIWDSPGQDLSTWGVDLDGEVNESVRASVGSYYSLFKYYLDVDFEREDVRTYFGEIRKVLSESASFSARYEYEVEEIDEYHTLRVGVTWRF